MKSVRPRLVVRNDSDAAPSPLALSPSWLRRRRSGPSGRAGIESCARKSVRIGAVNQKMDKMTRPKPLPDFGKSAGASS
jgi:hypothetical protein